MENFENSHTNWTVCSDCHGKGQKSRRISKKNRLAFEIALAQFENNNGTGLPPVKPKAALYTCLQCTGSGIIPSENPTSVDTENFPHVAIIGGGIGGVALAVACLHRGIPFTLFERDADFDARSQGYGLTLQQASKAIAGLGIVALATGVVSTRHVVHTTDGSIIGEWGVRKWMQSDANYKAKKTNIHIARQHLRKALLDQLEGHEAVQWGHQFMGFETTKDQKITLTFDLKGAQKKITADLLVGADGIRSTVRKLLIGEEKTPLRYLGCIVILGICSLESLENAQHPLLDSATVFQTANGQERMYMMPYTADTIMWQFSFPMSETAAKTLSAQGPAALKEEAIKRTPWHDPIPQIIQATPIANVSGYPVYDRELLQHEMLQNQENITLIGDAAHPMSPFKGQGANQALLDALRLARTISTACKPGSQWREKGIRASVLEVFETEMLTRSAVKVNDSASAAQFLHSELVLHKSDAPRGNIAKKL